MCTAYAGTPNPIRQRYIMHKEFLMGNEAIAIGALAAAVIGLRRNKRDRLGAAPAAPFLLIPFSRPAPVFRGGCPPCRR